MQPLACFRAAHLLPYLDLLREVGAPIDGGLQRAGLPVRGLERLDAYVPLVPAVAFLKDMGRREGVDEFGLRAARNLQLANFEPSLLAALEIYGRFVGREDVNVIVSLTACADGLRVYSRSCFPLDPEGRRLDDSSQLMAALAIVRAFAGPRWIPAEVSFHSPLAAGPIAQEVFADARLVVDAPAASMLIPRRLLSVPTREPRPAGQLSAGVVDLSLPPLPDFKTSLKAVLSTYLADGAPPVGVAAELASTSIRSLQRHLKESGLTYSELLAEIRFDSARQLLAETDLSVLDVSLELGYKDPSNFARAFRRLAGVSPREYRKISTTNAVAIAA